MLHSRMAASTMKLAAVLLVLFTWALPAFAQTPSFAPPPAQRNTYTAAAALALPQTGAGDAVCIYGAANKVVRIKQITLTGIKTTAESDVVRLQLHSAVNTGGTSTVTVNVPLDFGNTTAGAATVRGYTVVPTSGASVGTARSDTIAFNAGTVGTPTDKKTWDWHPGDLLQEVVLRTAAQGACVNFPNAFTTDGPTINYTIVWTEQ